MARGLKRQELSCVGGGSEEEEKRREEKGVDARSSVGVLFVVALGETPNHEPFFLSSFMD